MHDKAKPSLFRRHSSLTSTDRRTRSQHNHACRTPLRTTTEKPKPLTLGGPYMVRYHALPSNSNPWVPSTDPPKCILPIHHAKTPKKQTKEAPCRTCTDTHRGIPIPPALPVNAADASDRADLSLYPLVLLVGPSTHPSPANAQLASAKANADLSSKSHILEIPHASPNIL